MKAAEIGSGTKITLGVLISLVAGVGALGSAVVSYAVTSATLQSEAANFKARLDYSDAKKDRLSDDLVAIRVDVAEIKGIVSELKTYNKQNK